jgi:predicted ATPase
MPDAHSFSSAGGLSLASRIGDTGAMDQPPALISLSARNFRSLRKVDLDLGPINVLVGPNAAGKSNVLDVLAFLGDASRSDLQPALERRGGFERVRFRGKSNRRAVEISLEAQLTKFSSPSAPDEYSLSFDVKRGGIERTEEFAFKRTQGKGRRIGLQGSRLQARG